MIKENIEYILLIIFIFIIYYIFFKKEEREYFENKEENLHIQKMIDFENEWMEKKFPIKKNYHSIIPLNVYQTWYTTDLPPKMKECHELLKKQNPEFTFHLFDDQNCQDFIKKHFDQKVLNAYNTLIPGAYKADLWRYCVLYIHGGIYLDMKFESMDGFTFNDYLDKEYYVLDIDGDSIYNALLICKPKSIIMFKSIFQILKHVKDKDYTNSDLSVTGTGMLKKIVSKEIKSNLVMRHKCIHYEKYIYKENIPIFKSYPRYYEDTPKLQSRTYYDYSYSRQVFVD
jgi:hypothetical protein